MVVLDRVEGVGGVIGTLREGTVFALLSSAGSAADELVESCCHSSCTLLRNLVLILLDPLVVLLLHRIKHVQQGQQLSVQIPMLL